MHVRDKDVHVHFTRESVDSVHHASCTLSAVVPRTGEDPGPTSYHKWIYDNWRAVYDYKALADTLDFISYADVRATPAGGSPAGPVAGYPWMSFARLRALAWRAAGKISLRIPAYSDWWFPAYDSISGSKMRGSDISSGGRRVLAKAAWVSPSGTICKGADRRLERT